MRIVCLFLFIQLVQFDIFSQGCLPDGFTFTTQAEIDSFTNLYPDCTEIIGDVNIEDSVINLEGLSQIERIHGDLDIRRTVHLKQLKGLSKLKTVEGDVEIGDNDSLLLITGFDSLFQVGGIIIVYDNYLLEEMDAFNNLDTIGDYIEIGDNTSMKLLDGFNALKEIPGQLQIEGNLLLDSILAFKSLEEIGGRLVLDKNGIKDFVGLSQVRRVGGTLRINFNHSLTNIHPLDSLKFVGVDLRIFNNEILSDCAVKLICTQFEILGDIDIFNNADGCMDLTQILEACMVVFPPNNSKDIKLNDYRIYPNPASSKIFIENISENDRKELTISIYNIMGIKIREQTLDPNESFDVSFMKNGYYYFLISENVLYEKLHLSKLYIQH